MAGAIDGLQLSPDGGTLWLVDDGWLYRFDVASVTLRKLTEIERPGQSHLALSADGATVFVVTTRGAATKVVEWNVRLSKRNGGFAFPPGELSDVVVSADGRSLVVDRRLDGVTALIDSQIEVWGLRDGSRRVAVGQVEAAVITPGGTSRSPAGRSAGRRSGSRRCA